MKLRIHWLLGTSLLIASAFFAGCGGGGGGGGIFGPDSDWEGITGPLDFSTLTRPAGFTSANWPVPAGAASFSVNGFSNASVSTVLLANFTSASQTIILSADQSPLQASVKSEVSPAVRAYPRSRSSDFYAGLRSLEDANSRLSRSDGSAAVRGSLRSAVPGATHDFKIYSEGGYFTVTGNLYASSQLPGSSGFLRFYADKDIVQGNAVTAYFNEIINGWNSIYTTMHATFGSELLAGQTPTGIDLGNDIYVLISPKLSEIDPLLAGFFYSGDLYPPDRLTTGISNELKIFYLNLRLEGDDELTTDIMKSTMAHEFQHMIFYSNRIKNSVTSDDAWLNETLSAYAESACGFSVASGKNQSKAIQMQYYFDRMHQTPLVQNEGWGSEAQYGEVALFGEWFAEEYPNAVKSLYSSTKTGMAAVEEVTGKSFETIFSQWMLAMYLDLPNSVYGFNTLDWPKTYDFPGLSSITLTGPIQAGENLINDADLDPSSITLMPLSCYMIKFQGGGNGQSLDFEIQSQNAVTVFELGK